MKVHGLHHVTAIAGDAQENLDFYAGVLGMRLVKKSVNQDDPGTYHLFYADAAGHPGTDLTFFPWSQMPAGRKGVGLAVEVPLAVPADSLPYWQARLAQFRVETATETRFGEQVLTFSDPHGLDIALVATSDPRDFAPWEGSPVPVEFQIRGLHAARLWERDLHVTARLLTEVLGFEAMGEENGWHRYGVNGGGSGNWVEILEIPDGRRGAQGHGSIHHIAWRMPDAEQEWTLRERLAREGRRPTEVIDRFWFKSVYFKEPGGVLFELATDGPGFGVDEDMTTLGEQLILPPWLEQYRPQIENALPPLTAPQPIEG